MTEKKFTKYQSLSSSALDHKPTKNVSFADSDSHVVRIPLPRGFSHRSGGSDTALTRRHTAVGHSPQLKQLRSSLSYLTLASALSNWLSTLIAYLLVHQYRSLSPIRAFLCSALAVLSLIQTILVIVYWDKSLQHRELVRLSLNTQKMPILPLSQSPKKLLICALECLWHLAIPVAESGAQDRFYLFGVPVTLSTDDFLFILIVLRNYHTLRLMYWSSHLPGLHLRFFAYVWKVHIRGWFVHRCYLAEYGLRAIGLIYTLMIIISGLIDFALEHGSPATGMLSTWDNLWVVSITQTTIGYGDAVPQSFFGQLTILISCFFGMFLLGLINSFSGSYFNLSASENDMYYLLTNRLRKRKYNNEAAILVQRWWRFIKARVRRAPKGDLVIKLFIQLTAYRTILLRCQDLHFLRLEKQISQLSTESRKRLSALRFRLLPVVTFSSQSGHFLHTIQSASSRCIKVRNKAGKLANGAFMRRFSLFPPEMPKHTMKLQLPNGPTMKRRKSAQLFAKLKDAAFLNAMHHAAHGTSFCLSSRPSSASVDSDDRSDLSRQNSQLMPD